MVGGLASAGAWPSFLWPVSSLWGQGSGGSLPFEVWLGPHCSTLYSALLTAGALALPAAVVTAWGQPLCTFAFEGCSLTHFQPGLQQPGHHPRPGDPLRALLEVRPGGQVKVNCMRTGGLMTRGLCGIVSHADGHGVVVLASREVHSGTGTFWGACSSPLKPASPCPQNTVLPCIPCSLLPPAWQTGNVISPKPTLNAQHSSPQRDGAINLPSFAVSQPGVSASPPALLCQLP